MCLDCGLVIDEFEGCECPDVDRDYEERPERERYEDDGLEYADPRDFRDELLERE
jgi:hypothetical protein